MQTNNKTLYGIHNNSERYSLITWTITVLISSVIGDSIILITSIKYHAIKLKEVIVVVIQHLAVCDLLIAIFMVLPTTVALIADDWAMGDILGHVEVHIPNTCYPATRLLTCAMTILKLLHLKYPLRTTGWSSRFGHKICGAMWTLVLCIYAPFVVAFIFCSTDTGTVQFDYVSYACFYTYFSSDAPEWLKYYNLIYISLVIIIPCIILLVTSVLILVLAKISANRHGGTLRWEGVITALLTVGVLFVSFLPYCATFMAWNLGQFNITVYRATHFLNFLNIMANFYVYSLTVGSFRSFLKLKISKLLRQVLPSTTITPACRSQNQFPSSPAVVRLGIYPPLYTGGRQGQLSVKD